MNKRNNRDDEEENLIFKFVILTFTFFQFRTSEHLRFWFSSLWTFREELLPTQKLPCVPPLPTNAFLLTEPDGRDVFQKVSKLQGLF